MLDFDTVLVSIDLARDDTTASRVLDWAACLAEPRGATVHVLYVLPVPTYDPVRALFHKLVDRSETEEALREHVTARIENSQLRRSGQHHRVERTHRRGVDEASEILRYADEIGADLVVMGRSRRQRSMQHLALGGVAGDVLRGADVPVLTVPPPGTATGASDRPAASIRHLLAPIDFSEHSGQAVPVARALAERFQAALSLLFVAEEHTVVTFSDTGLPGFQSLQADAQIAERAPEALRRLYHQAGGGDESGKTGLEPAYHLRHGQPARQIIRFTEEQEVDFILQSAHGVTGHALINLGSVAEHVVRRAPCPVLTLKSPPDGGPR